jgi:hypothetical protein
MTSPKKPVVRRDATGHLDPEYQRKLLAESGHSRTDDGRAFLDEAPEDLAEELGEGYLQAATSGENAELDRLGEVVPEESGGPFIETPAGQEFAGGTDESNIAEATREALPRTSSSDP